MSPGPDSAALNVQPRQRRDVYAALAKAPEGRSVKELLSDLGIDESELRETLRKLDSAGLAHRAKGTWRAVPLEPDRGSHSEPELDHALPAG
jgi:DNA-binding transcriptional ArsR family regulator